MKRNKFLAFLMFYFLWLGLFSLRADPAWPKEDGAQSQEKISFDLKDVSIPDVLRILSLKTGKTIVADQSVTGRMTLFVNNVTFSDVLDIIVLSQSLAYVREGNIFHVMTEARYRAVYGAYPKDKRSLKIIKLSYAKPANVFNVLAQVKSDIGKIIADEASGTVILMDTPQQLEVLENTVKELDQPLQTKIFDLNYAKAADAKAQLSSAITPGTGEVIVDERSGKAFVTDLPKKIEKVSRLVRELDQETRQVFIEADIIEVNLSDKFQRGIDWEKVFSSRSLDGLDFAGKFPLTLTNYQQIAVGTVARNMYNVILNFLQTYGDVKTISQPRISVVNNEEAKIMVGTRDAYVTQTLSQAESTTVTSEAVEFIDVGVKFKVIPTINSDGFITMKIKPEVSSVKEVIETSLGSRIPIVQTSEAETVVKIKDGAMIMIAGLLKEEKKDTVKGVYPFSKIPFLGALFSNREKENNRTELIVFLTPHITRGEVPVAGFTPEEAIPEGAYPQSLRRKKAQAKMMDISFMELESKKSQEISEQVKEILKIEEAKKPGQPEVTEPKVEQPKPEQPKVEEPKPEQPKVEQPKVIEQPEKIEPAVTKPETKAPAETGKAMEIKDPRYYYRKGMQSQKQGKWDEAGDYLSKAISLDPNFTAAYNQLGIVLESQGLAERAEKMYLKALSIDPEYAPVYSNLALLNEDRHNTNKAIEYWQRRVKLGKPNDPWTQEAERRLGELTRLIQSAQ